MGKTCMNQRHQSGNAVGVLAVPAKPDFAFGRLKSSPILRAQIGIGHIHEAKVSQLQLRDNRQTEK